MADDCSASVPTLPLGPAASLTAPSSVDPDSSVRSWQSGIFCEQRSTTVPPTVAAAAAALVSAARVANGSASTVRRQSELEALRQKQELAMSLLEQRGQVTPQPSAASLVVPTASLGPPDPSSVEEAVASAAKAARGYTGKVSCSYDEVERCISELQGLVKACRGPLSPQELPQEVGPAPDNRSRAKPHEESLVQKAKKSSGDQVSSPSAAATLKRAPSVPRRQASATPRAERHEELSSPDDLAARAEDPAVKSRNEVLQAEAASLRDELREADKQIKVASLQAATVNAELRDRRHRHQQWVRRMQEEATKLRRESQRLERSFHQAGVEERRIAELAKAQPEISAEKLRLLEANCDRLQVENQRLERELAAGQTELSNVRDVVTSAGGHRALSLQRGTSSCSAPKLSCSSSTTPPTPCADVVRTLEHDSSLPQLRPRFRG
ncbi:unnamed protein product [Symbiodinium natans]|uniref:Uncharacterized protein n=1 Tax=Symbiodinium natans TaxID=878477 RepID=A0A812RQR2_9DINO|nr:unnamed protein product [Symbiodinium natans]